MVGHTVGHTDPYGVPWPLPDDCVHVVHAFARPVHATTRVWGDVRFLRCDQCRAPVARMKPRSRAGSWTFTTVDDHRVYLCPYEWCGMADAVVCRACARPDDVCHCLVGHPGVWSRVPHTRVI